MQRRPSKTNESSGFGLRDVGKQTARHLARLDIHSVKDLLLHLPARYQDRTCIEPMRHLVMDHEAVIEGVITSTLTPHRGRTKLLCELRDETGRVHLRFFHLLSFQKNILKSGTRLRCYGEVRLGPKGPEMIHPEFQVMMAGKKLPVEQFLTPVYPATEGLSQYMLRKLTGNALALLVNDAAFRELVPADVLQSLSFPEMKDALFYIHRPPREASIAELMESKTLPQKRIIFEELLAHRISLLRLKSSFQHLPGIALPGQGTLHQTFVRRLPFTLTHAQQRVVNEISQDMQKTSPMLRLIQGDVGSGKTVVAALAMLQAIENGSQAALMAPTELLSEQHYRVFKNWFEALGVEVVFLSGSVKSRARTAALKKIANGDAQVVLGTHALFQDEVQFSKLALVIVDEQHRFGVHQRALFREKGKYLDHYPHQLVMTATPIPRTLAMSFYADLDCSVIDELPPGRTPVVTTVLANTRREEVIERVRHACKENRQVYWVCPLIDESEVLTCQDATTTAEQLQLELPEVKVGLVHGRMTSEAKESVMSAFKEGKMNVLVATTVIEVGVDVPNASVMVIENAERMGLSQLHQLRGRVGRGAVASYCVLLYQAPLSDIAKERLAVMRETTDGFRIAERDLELRGPGEMLGTRQTGDLSFRVADLMRDSHMLPVVQKAAELIIREHSDRIEPLIKRWLGNGNQYGKV